MSKLKKIDREVRRVLHKLPVVGKHVEFPPKSGKRPGSSFTGNDHLAALSGTMESQLHALSGLRMCSSRQETELRTQAEQIRELESSLDKLSQMVGDEQQQLRERIEFARTESLLEVRRLRGTHSGAVGGDASETLVPIVKDTETVEQLRSSGDLRINLGCGHKPLDSYVNVDCRELPGIQVLANVDNLPFGAGELAEIHSAHLVEHFELVVLERDLMPYWFELLRPGGKISAIVPDASAMMRSYVEGGMTFEEIREVTYGGQDYAENFHYTMFNVSSMASLLEGAGFRNISVIAEGRRNGLCFELEMTAEKP